MVSLLEVRSANYFYAIIHLHVVFSNCLRDHSSWHYATHWRVYHEREYKPPLILHIHSNDTLPQLLTIFKVAILVFVVITGWVVISGKTHIVNPQANFIHAFAGSSHNGGDVSVASIEIDNDADNDV